jgi:hypothetical protein
MRNSCKRSSGGIGTKNPAAALAILLAFMAMPAISCAQDTSQSESRTAQRFTFNFEPDEAVELELTPDLRDEDEQQAPRADEFLRLNLFNGRTAVSSIEFNLARLRLIRLTATRTGFGDAELFINGRSVGMVPVRRNRIHLVIQMFVNIPQRDYQTDELILTPSETALKGLMTFVDLDGTRRTRTIVTSTIKVPVTEAN